jgi:prevent-host-death family protein
MSKRYSIAEARHNLAAIVHELEVMPHIELTRRGEPVAILLSIDEFRRLSANETRFWDAYVTFRDAVKLPELQLELEIFDGVRDRSSGREVHL